jgi:hypothetical protein
MDLSQAAFGLDMRAASRIYFVNPVLNPQVEAQAIGRVRRISQQKPVSVETLVLRDSIDEVILERKQHMTQAEHRQVKSILDVRPIYNWIKNAAILDLAQSATDAKINMAALQAPQPVFGGGFGARLHPDDGIILGDSPVRPKAAATNFPRHPPQDAPKKRKYDSGHGRESTRGETGRGLDSDEVVTYPVRRVRFASDSD